MAAIRNDNVKEKILDAAASLVNSSSIAEISLQKIADQAGVSKGTIYHINKGLTVKNNNQLYPIRKKI